jgi:hypothetical protein
MICIWFYRKDRSFSCFALPKNIGHGILGLLARRPKPVSVEGSYNIFNSLLRNWWLLPLLLVLLLLLLLLRKVVAMLYLGGCLVSFNQEQ